MSMHQSPRRQWLLASASWLVLAAAPWPARAQGSYPSQSIRIVVPFGPGGIGDLTARAVGQKLAERLGQPVVIENRPGAGGVAAAESVARAAPDGHTLFLMSNGTAVSAGLFRKLPFDTVKDFVPISTLGYFDIAVVANSQAPFTTLGEVIAHARANPGKLNVGSINVGSTQNLTAELFKSSAGIDVQVVPFNGTPALVAALRGRQVDVAVEILGPVLPQIHAGELRPLAVTGEVRSIVQPRVPTAREAGVLGLVASSWNALAAPAGTPAAVVQRLQREIDAALQDPDVRQRLRTLSVDARSSTPQEAAALLAADIERWTRVIERSGIPKQ
ncbi:MAG: tripartite tricarboxylate transporter substrate binding protein [Hydrogenophaga sp.]|jgi:tripartite-type tricarboxylate transporter receptor subunit TctC|nr:tripartite tricarboxylate transporter substrate binding protein [Hydrogenophaga sp.]